MLFHTLLASLFSMGRPLLCCWLGEGLPHFSPGVVPQSAGHCGWDMGGRGIESHAALATCPWLASRTGRGPHLQLSFLGLSILGVWLELHLEAGAGGGPECSCQHAPPQWGLMVLQRRVERGGDTILSLLVTHTFQGLMGSGLSFGSVGPPG